MDKTATYLVRGFFIVVISACLIAYLNLVKKTSLIFPKPIVEDLRYKQLEKKLANAEIAAKRDSINYLKFGSTIFCSTSMNSWVELVNYTKQMDMYIFDKDADLSELNKLEENFEKVKTRSRVFNP